MHRIARRTALPLGAVAIIAAAACTGAPTSPEPAAAVAPSHYYATPPTPPPPPPPPPPVPEDSVVGGYGSGSTGGLEYETFEYEPETQTEYVVTPDTSATERGLTPTAPK
jgi:hypothetical protein